MKKMNQHIDKPPNIEKPTIQITQTINNRLYTVPLSDESYRKGYFYRFEKYIIRFLSR